MPAPATSLSSIVLSGSSISKGQIHKDYNGGALTVEERYYRVAVTSAELLALNATPKTLVPAPGAGKVLELVSVMAFMNSATPAYAGVAAGEDLTIGYTDGSGVVASTTLETTGFIDQTTAQIRTFKPITTDITPVVNAPLVLHLESGEITTGTGVLYLNILVRIHETGL